MQKCGFVYTFCVSSVRKEPSQVEVLNDIDGHLTAFFELIKDDIKRLKLVQTLNSMPYSRRLWREIRTRWKKGNIPADEIERVAWWYYLNRTTFASDQRRGGFAAPSVTGRNPVKSFRNNTNSLDTIAKRLRVVNIENLEYHECIKRYDSEDTLFFCDPPYLGGEHYYGNTFSQNDHYRLSDILHDVKGKVMLTHYQNSVYDELYKGWHQDRYTGFKGSHKSSGDEKPKTTEVLYCKISTSEKLV